MSARAARITQPIAAIRTASCDRCGRRAMCQTVNFDTAIRWCLGCIALPPAPRELVLEPPRKVARGSRP